MSTTVPRAEVRAVSDFLARVRPGPAALVVEGEAGIGKSTLMLSAVEVARSQGFLVLSTRGSTAEVEHAFAAVSDLLAGIDEAFLDDLPSPQRNALDRVRDALKRAFRVSTNESSPLRAVLPLGGLARDRRFCWRSTMCSGSTPPAER